MNLYLNIARNVILKGLNSYAVSTAIVYFLIYGVPLLGKGPPSPSMHLYLNRSLPIPICVWVVLQIAMPSCLWTSVLSNISKNFSLRPFNSLFQIHTFFLGLYIIVTLYGFFVLSVLILNFYERLVMWCYWTTNIQCRLVYIITWFYDRLS